MKVVTVGLFALATGCAVDSTQAGRDTPQSAEPVAPHLGILLTDAPGDFDAVWVDIAKVEIESADAGWLALTDTRQKFDLLQLRNDVTAALGGATLEPGTYGQIRLLVDSASVVIAGIESPLEIASGAQTGVKIPLDQTLEQNMTYSLTLDFDAARSVKQTGRGYLMTPVVQVKGIVATPVSTTNPDGGIGSGDAGSGV